MSDDGEPQNIAEVAESAKVHGERVEGLVTAAQAADAGELANEADAPIDSTITDESKIREEEARKQEMRNRADEKLKKDAIERMGGNEGTARALLAFSDQIEEHPTMDQAAVNSIVTSLTSTNPPIKQEQLAMWIEKNHPDLDSGTKTRIQNEIINRLQHEDPKDHEISDQQADRMYARAKGVKDRAETQAQRLQDKIEGSNLSKEEKARKKTYIEKKLKHITEWFIPDEPGKTWVRRIGKTLYWALVIAFLLIIFEMNLINKAAGNRRK